MSAAAAAPRLKSASIFRRAALFLDLWREMEKIQVNKSTRQALLTLARVPSIFRGATNLVKQFLWPSNKKSMIYWLDLFGNP